jgi:hypothetical protein
MSLERLQELAARLGGEQAAAALSADVGTEATCERLLSEMVGRRVPCGPDAAAKWSAFAPLLVALEQMSWTEMAALDARAEQAKAAARAAVDILPAQVQMRCRACIALVAETEADLAAFRTEPIVGRMSRALAANSRATVREGARDLERDMLARLIDATDSLYPLACTADEMLRAACGDSASLRAAPAAPSCLTQLTARRQRFVLASGALADSKRADPEAEFHVGLLSQALGGASIAGALDTLRGSALPSVASIRELKTSAADAVAAALQRHSVSVHADTVRTVDHHIADRFLDLKHMLDEWLSGIHRWCATVSGLDGDAQTREAARAEILGIWQQAVGDARRG